ncbi:hypothetical protein [Mycobacterium sp. 94-17]|uniref:hypothetical protein n=1 Tax=Mycobacterium sp. 94-17 TaxID=2986147 RepID=UPI002D1F15FF|nr:hypothetical protein [Mycobacterium sp. 94-17]MEB4210746.1 hypothetical protein [Mycobacterium sp. 94-17]
MAVRVIYLAVTVALSAAVLLVAAPAHADLNGYRSCVGSITEPVSGPDPQNLQLVGEVEQELSSGVSPAAETQKIARRGFDPALAHGIVQCVIEEHP